MNPLDTVPKEDKQKSSGSTNLDFVEFEYEWTIRDFNLICDDYFCADASIKSPTFSVTTTNGTYLWSFKLSRQDIGHDQRKIEISLNLESKIEDEILVKYQFTVLNKDRVSSKIQTLKRSTSFSENKKSYSSLFEYVRHIRDAFGRRIIYNDSSNNLLKINDTIIILFEGKFFVSTRLTSKLNTIDLLNTKAELSTQAIQDILHFLYTGQTINATNLQEGLLMAGDNLKFKEQLEDKLFSELNIQNAAEVYKFVYSHNKTDLKNKVMEFIKRNGTAVTATNGWMSLLESSDPTTLTEIIDAFSNNSNSTTNNDN